ncbi:hypothetical protein EVJ58_g4977 [Rhodofomes roseus]|uniref:Metallothionein n=1 Tax=Rhodofomes roseus TaxID=34475 RepID=A0A4Y9YDS5_9APHY|nr:hypothetical protein EVJ58_g4977 [Rhodofomes roseus]
MFTNVAVPVNAANCGQSSCSCGDACQCKPNECKC